MISLGHDDAHEKREGDYADAQAREEADGEDADDAAVEEIAVWVRLLQREEGRRVYARGKPKTQDVLPNLVHVGIGFEASEEEAAIIHVVEALEIAEVDEGEYSPFLELEA